MAIQLNVKVGRIYFVHLMYSNGCSGARGAGNSPRAR